MHKAILGSALALICSASAHAAIAITEVHPTGSGNAPYAADFIELTNTGPAAVDITGWKMDDNSNTFANAVALRGVTSIGAGQSVVFIEGDATGSNDATNQASFITAWFGGSAPAGLALGGYGGSGVGLGAGGDAVNIFDAAGTRITGVAFGAATANVTFDNTAGAGSTTLPLPTISTLSVAGVNAAFVSPAGETGSPGAVPEPATLGALALGAVLVRRRSR